MDSNNKRKAETGADIAANNNRKKSKGPKGWQVAKRGQKLAKASGPSIEAGDAGIWATCDKNTEGKCTAELRDLFNEYAERIYGKSEMVDTRARGDGEAEGDIEADIKHEIEGLQVGRRTPLFQPVRLEVQCVLFFKTRAPVEPVSFVHGICADAMKGTLGSRSRCVRKLTPMTLMGKATEKSLEEVSRVVLGPHFHAEGVSPKTVGRLSAVACTGVSRNGGRSLAEPAGRKKFAIRFSCRNHQTLTRDAVIKQVADAVGRPHSVDLGKYDALIIVEIYKNMCGMSVVGNDFEALRRYNLAEIHDARRAHQVAEGRRGEE
ncbi:hypothetical protein MMC11_001876 [Xylographa trunciseda]|nr:hypothetical protein [Xylographa trunciseda]